MEISLKRYEELTVDELYDILKARVDVFVVEQKCPYAEIDGKDKKSLHLICSVDGKIAGYMRIVEKGVSYEEVSIGRVITTKEYRGKGIATRLMNFALDYIRTTLGENAIRIGAQEYLFNFYSSFGFKKIGNTYDEDGISHIEMLLTF